jgi:hypothetical protein
MSLREEQQGRFYLNNRKESFIVPESPFKADYDKLKEEQDADKLREILLEAEKQKQKELEEKLERLEMLPIGPRLIVLPYPTNPYRKVLQGSIIVDYSETFKNPDSGEQDKLASGVICAKVIEVGPECKWIKPGDDIFCQNGVLTIVPFFSLGYKTLAEQQVLSVIGEKLKERFKMTE